MYRVEITLGNEAMTSPEDVAQALRDVADRLEAVGVLGGFMVLDANGNSVGNAWNDEVRR